MKTVCVLLSLIVVATTQDLTFPNQVVPRRFIPIVEHTESRNPDGSFNLRYETANGIAQQEHSEVTVDHRGQPSVRKTGSYGYTAPDGTPVSISYIADEHGFRVAGNPLPVAAQPAAPALPLPAFL
nr:PREDICTED: endocuticle structural glycoprotein SgAbd-2-like [Bemisia tabaci]